MSAPSLASSPRLPSPPPIAEDQTHPASPGLLSPYEPHNKFEHTSNGDQGASRRIRPGTRAEYIAEGPPLIDFHEIDSAFQLTEHLSALHYSLTHPLSSPPTTRTSQPITKQTALVLAKPPTAVEPGIWLYELCRFLTNRVNSILIALFADTPACSSVTCPEMRASEWQYLCAVHDPPKSCCAIDYCCHTLDWAAQALTSSKTFPSRLALGTGGEGRGGAESFQLRQITNVMRRVYRIFAHAWFQHREVFWRVETRTGLYVFFKTVCDEYRLIQEDGYTVPPEAEGVSSENTPIAGEQQHSILKHEEQEKQDVDDGHGESQETEQAVGSVVQATGTTSKRHRHTLSDRSVSVSTVIHEEDEDDEGSSEQHKDGQGAIYVYEETSSPIKPDTQSQKEAHKQSREDTAHNSEEQQTQLPVEIPSTTDDNNDTANPSEDQGTSANLPQAEQEPGEDHEPSIESMYPTTSEAAAPDDAGKSVGD
ncbi:hypothetical protein LTR66_006704 [Elasticomyces elasticus]|nr:hypothetical protein LTR66_006704 [Elasticomyces elasticus]